jgi:hypothetical protein
MMLTLIPVVGSSLAIVVANFLVSIPITILALDMLGIISPVSNATYTAITIPILALTFALAF